MTRVQFLIFQSNGHAFMRKKDYPIQFVILLTMTCIFTYLVPCCDVSYDFSIKTMLGSSLPTVGCSSAHVLFMLYALVCA